jgi:predicted deacylase
LNLAALNPAIDGETMPNGETMSDGETLSNGETLLPGEVAVPDRFADHELRLERLREAADREPCIEYRLLGASEEGRDIGAVVFGRGSRTATLIAGSHADEPVGSETLMALVREVSRHPDSFRALLNDWRILVVPHVNPDGEARNRGWIDAWPGQAEYVNRVVRERPGRDIEFGYPDLRTENRVVAGALAEFAPVTLHMSLHGMGYSDGAMLLIERHWAFRTDLLRDRFREAARDAGLDMHDHNRKGEKGFFQIEPGYTTTPEGAAMRAYFRAARDPEVAALFRDSSMEHVRSLGGDPLCVVTELPLFVVEGAHRPGIPDAYLAVRDEVKGLRSRYPEGIPAAILNSLPVRPLPLDVAMSLQWKAIDLSLRQAGV